MTPRGPRFYRRGVFRRAQTSFRGLRNFPDKSEGRSIPVPLTRRNNEFASLPVKFKRGADVEALSRSFRLDLDEVCKIFR